MSSYDTALEYFDQKKNLEAKKYFLEVINDESETLKNKIDSYKKLFLIVPKKEKNYSNELLKFLYQKKEISKCFHYIEDKNIEDSEEILKIKIDVLESLGEFSKAEKFKFILSQYYFSKKVYFKNEIFLKENTENIIFTILRMVNASKVFDKKVLLDCYSVIHDHFSTSLKSQDTDDENLLKELMVNLNKVKGVDVDIDNLIDRIRLIYSMIQLQRGREFDQGVVKTIIDVLVYSDDLETKILCFKNIVSSNDENLIAIFLNAIERDKEFKYLEHIKNDRLLKFLFEQHREKVTIANKSDQPMEIDITLYEVQRPKDPIANILSKYAEKEVDNLNSDSNFMKRIELNEFDDHDKENLLFSLTSLGLKKSSYALIEKYKDSFTNYQIAHTKFIFEDYFAVIEICNEEILDKENDRQGLEGFMRLKMNCLNKMEQFKAAEKLKRYLDYISE